MGAWLCEDLSRLVTRGTWRSKRTKTPPKLALSFQPTPIPQNMSVSFHSFWILGHKTVLIISGLTVCALRGWSSWRDTHVLGSRGGENNHLCPGRLEWGLRGNLPHLLPLTETGQEPWGSGSSSPGLPGHGDSIPLSHREANSRTPTAFPKHLHSGV